MFPHQPLASRTCAAQVSRGFAGLCRKIPASGANKLADAGESVPRAGPPEQAHFMNGFKGDASVRNSVSGKEVIPLVR
jgi:hypothetical protein